MTRGAERGIPKNLSPIWAFLVYIHPSGTPQSHSAEIRSPLNPHPPMNHQLSRYSRVAMVLHWVLAVAILGSMAMGAFMSELELSPQKLKLYNWHKWAGVTILALSLLRLLWRLARRPPPLPPRIALAMPAWQVSAHHATHRLMYALFFIVPLAGWAYSSMAGYPVVWFGVLPLPDFVPVNKELAESLEDVHGLLAYTLLALVALHVAGALKHQFIDRDGLMSRMLPSMGRSSDRSS